MRENQETEIAQDSAVIDRNEDRRRFLAKFASATFAGLVAPAVTGEARALEVAQAVRVPDVPLYSGLDEEDVLGRMDRDLRRALQKPVDQRNWTMVIDLEKCVGCQGCTIACIQENKLPPGIVCRPVREEVKGTYPNVAKRFTPQPCMQCDDPPCARACKAKAIEKRPDGIVKIDYEKCEALKTCIPACPYQAIGFDAGGFWGDYVSGEPEAYEKLDSLEYGQARSRAAKGAPIDKARKCQFCLHRISSGLLPACVLSCMGRATFFGDQFDPDSLVAQLIRQPNVMRLKEEAGTNPLVYYLEGRMQS